MIHCRNCINWVDESLEQIEADASTGPHLFMGCRIYGFREGNATLDSCPHYVESENLFTICQTCRITVPKVCVSLGECANCTDTDLFCIENCIGGDNRKYCTHFIRLYTEGAHLIDQNQAFDLFPTLGMPGAKQESRAPKAPPRPGRAGTKTE
jgi:hypothetical protein